MSRMELWMASGEPVGVVSVPPDRSRREIEVELVRPLASVIAALLGLPVEWGEPEEGEPPIRLGTAWPDGRVVEYGFA